MEFDKYEADQRFYGMKRLNFQGNRYDSSYLKEKLSYDLYAAMGIISPRASWALVRVNDEPQGLFGMVEAIDGRFTSDRWPDNGDGNLFAASVELNRTSPITDAQSLRVLFDFGNEEKAWDQWTIFRVPLVGAPKDLTTTTLTGIRFKARSNKARELRFNLDSPKHTKANDGIQFGWDLNLTTETQTLAVLFADAEIPGWATDPGDKLADILQTTVAITFQPACAGRSTLSGQLPAGTTDTGWAEFDDIEFF